MARTMPIDFTAIDFETANRSPASACAVGLVRVRNGEVVAEDQWLIQPPAGHDHFEPFNVQLHGISAEHVSRAPSWTAQLERLMAFIGNDAIAAHNARFDLGVIAAAQRATGHPVPALRYVCSLRLARATYDLPSYRLPKAAAAAGFTLEHHHDPLEDARACAAIVIDVAQRRSESAADELKAMNIQVSPGEPLQERSDAIEALIHGATF